MSVKAKRRAKAHEIRGTNARAVLSKLFRRMLVYVAGTVNITEDNIDKIPIETSTFLDQMVSSGRYEQLMVNFVKDPRNCIPDSKKLQSSARGNLQKELLNSGMSWKVFIKGMRFLGLVGIDIQITAHHANGKKSIHKEHVNLGKHIVPTGIITAPTNELGGRFPTPQPRIAPSDELNKDVSRAWDISNRNNKDI